MGSVRAVVGLVLLALQAPAGPPATKPIVSVWYRGAPSGTPRLDDLAALRAFGFTTVSWPDELKKGESDLRRFAGIVGLSVDVRSPSAPLTAERALAPTGPADIHVDTVVAADVPALVWRAVAHGSRMIAFDPGTGSEAGWTTATGEPAPWVASARELARQFIFNESLIETLRQGPRVTLPPGAPAGLDVVVLAGDRSWVIIATNTSRDRVRAEVTLPAGIPAALWANLLDGSGMSMLNTPQGPRWALDLQRGEARVYAIDKNAQTHDK